MTFSRPWHPVAVAAIGDPRHAEATADNRVAHDSPLTACSMKHTGGSRDE